VVENVEASTAAGSTTVRLLLLEQPFKSTTVAVYTPADSPVVVVATVSELDH
jgi:hypothetical protein